MYSLYYTIPYCSILSYTILYHTIFYYTILPSRSPSPRLGGQAGAAHVDIQELPLEELWKHLSLKLVV